VKSKKAKQAITISKCTEYLLSGIKNQGKTAKFNSSVPREIFKKGCVTLLQKHSTTQCTNFFLSSIKIQGGDVI